MASDHHVNYRRIYFILLAALVVSVAGPFLEVLLVTLVTAFGIAVYKASLVVANFMHLRFEKRLMRMILATSLLLMTLFVAGVAPDIMNHEGNNWVNLAAKSAVEREGPVGRGDDDHPENEAAETVVAFDARATYDIACATCHGQAGDGTGAGGAALDPPPADFTDPAFWAERDEERIFNVIKYGAASVGGSSLMVAWGLNYDDEQIQALTEYVMGFRPDG